MVVGHSLGGSAALRVLALGAGPSPEAVSAVVRIAASCWDARDPDWPVAAFGLPPGADDALAATEVLRLHGTADEDVAPVHADRLQARLPSATVRRIEGMDHEAASHAGRIAEVLRPLVNDGACPPLNGALVSCAEGASDSPAPEPWLSDTRSSYDIDAPGYAEQVRGLLVGNPHLQASLALFAELVQRSGGGPVADVGCGPGYVTGRLRELGVEAFGIDLSPEMVSIARCDHPDARFEIGTMTDLDLDDDAVTGLVAFWSVIHIPDYAMPAVVAEFRRVLRPGGPLLVGFHVGEGKHHTAEGDTRRAISVDSHRRRSSTIRAWLHGAGFTIESELVIRPDEEVPGAVILARSAT